MKDKGKPYKDSGSEKDNIKMSDKINNNDHNDYNPDNEISSGRFCSISEDFNLNDKDEKPKSDVEFDKRDEPEELDSGEKLESSEEKNKKSNKDFERVVLKSKKNKYFFRAIWFVLIAFVSTLLVSYALVSMNDMLGIGKSDNTISVEIPNNASLDNVAGILKSSGIIKQDAFFKLYCFITKNTKGFLHGTYELRPNMDYQVIINKIKSQTANKDVVEIAFREGMNVQECASLLSENGVCSEEDFLEKCNSDEFDDKYDFLKEIKNKSERYYKLEGYLFPDTYEFYKGEDPSSVIRRFLNNFQKKIIKVNTHEGYDKNTSIKHLCEEQGKTLDEIINISSMIQSEAANKKDMYKVSSVIYNRLSTVSSDGNNKFGEFGLSKLGIDSTVWYPYKTKSAVPEDIVNSFQSRFDTYEITGLPPGAISNPGLEAIYAALKPESTDYYYFCHSDSGDAYYAQTNDQHLANLKKAGLA